MQNNNNNTNIANLVIPFHSSIIGSSSNNNSSFLDEDQHDIYDQESQCQTIHNGENKPEIATILPQSLPSQQLQQLYTALFQQSGYPLPTAVSYMPPKYPPSSDQDQGHPQPSLFVPATSNARVTTGTMISLELENPLPTKQQQQKYEGSQPFPFQKSGTRINTTAVTVEHSQYKQATFMIPDDRSGTMNSEVRVLEDEYFQEDTNKMKEMREKLMNPSQFYKLRDHQTVWSNAVLVEFIVYHVLFYFAIGPLINILFFPRRTLFHNLSFIGHNKYFYVQTAIFLLNVATLLLFFGSDNSTRIYTVEIVYMEIGIFLRIFVISCKYASLPKEKIEMYRRYVLGTELTAHDFYFAKWIYQDHSTIYREVYNALQRGDYDPQMFYVKFFMEPSAEKRKEMISHVEQLKKFHRFEKEEFQPACIFQSRSTTQSIYGYGIAGLLLQKFAENNKNSSLLIAAIVMAVFRGLLTLLFRFIVHESVDFNTNEAIQIIGVILITTYGYFSSFIFIIYFIRDLRMKEFLQNQCKLMLEFRKNDVDDMKLLPTIDFTDPDSLKGWSILRRVLLDYGRSYFMRIQAFLKMYLLVAVTSFGILGLNVYKVFNGSGELIVICLFEIGVILTSLLYMLYRGSQINLQFSQFKNALVDYRVLILDLIRLKSIYFSGTAVIANLLRRYAVSRIIENLRRSLKVETMTAAATTMTMTTMATVNAGAGGNELTEQEKKAVDGTLEAIMQSIQESDAELDQDTINQPFTLFSIIVTEPFMQSILVTLATIAGALFQQVIRNMKGT